MGLPILTEKAAYDITLRESAQRGNARRSPRRRRKNADDGTDPERTGRKTDEPPPLHDNGNGRDTPDIGSGSQPRRGHDNAPLPRRARRRFHDNVEHRRHGLRAWRRSIHADAPHTRARHRPKQGREDKRPLAPDMRRAARTFGARTRNRGNPQRERNAAEPAVRDVRRHLLRALRILRPQRSPARYSSRRSAHARRSNSTT